MKSPLNHDRLQKTLLVVSFLSIILAFLYIACGGDSIDYDRKAVSESLAKFALRAYGETQYAYAMNSSRGHYGTWDNLRDRHYISEGATGTNIIADYIFWAAVDNPYSHSHTILPGNSFTAVAFPRFTRPAGFLATFAIREDKIVRIYLPDAGVNAFGENDDYGVRTWEPVK